jgi:peptidoglycan/xylan/chitin deacetylase (PgdA/CDA1 family)
MASRPRPPPPAGGETARLEALRRRRRARLERERRRRAAIRRRRFLVIAALASAVFGAVVGGRANNPGPPGQPSSPGRVLVHWRRPVPILMYHVIASSPADAPNPQLFTKPLRFAAQMDYLAKSGYTAVTLDQVYDAWTKDGLIPKNSIVISFDDGYRGDYTDAMPILREHDWRGVLNLELGSLENGELTEPMIAELLAAGWELDSHTISHLDLRGMSPPMLKQEVAGSRDLLRKRFGVPVNFFCYPAGRYDAPAVAEVRKAGYLGATTTQPGLASRRDLYKLRRIRIDQSDGVAALAEKLKRAGA